MTKIIAVLLKIKPFLPPLNSSGTYLQKFCRLSHTKIVKNQFARAIKYDLALAKCKSRHAVVGVPSFAAGSAFESRWHARMNHDAALGAVEAAAEIRAELIAN